MTQVVARGSPRIAAPAAPMPTALPVIAMGDDDTLSFVASWKVPRATTAGPGGTDITLQQKSQSRCSSICCCMLMLRWDVHAGIPDPQLEVQILQLDAHGNLIEGGLLDRDHPRTEWKNPVRTNPHHCDSTACHSALKIAWFVFWFCLLLRCDGCARRMNVTMPRGT